jgi:hypothetical protein
MGSCGDHLGRDPLLALVGLGVIIGGIVAGVLVHRRAISR